MDQDAILLMIRDKLADGRLPHDSIPKFWGGPGHGEICAACQEAVARNQFVIEAARISSKRAPQFHVQCFYLWDAVRKVPGR
jgi:hypothetical protein